MDDPYKFLRIKENSTEFEVKQAYREKIKSTHPDKGGNVAEFKKTIEAKNQILNNDINKDSDDKSKSLYNKIINFIS